MANRYNTNSEVPSNTLPDLNDNMQVFDAFVNQESGSVMSRKGINIPVLQEQVGGRIDALTADAQAALTGAQASASDAAQSAVTSGIIANNLGQPPGSGLVGSSPSEIYPEKTVGAKLNRWVDFEDFSDENSAAGDWATAIQAATDFAISSGIWKVRGIGDYAISKPINIQGLGIRGGFQFHVNTLRPLASFPQKTSYWDAKQLVLVGDVSVPAVGQATALDIRIANAFGTHEDVEVAGYEPVCDAVATINGGMATSFVHVGIAKGCVAVVRYSDHNQNNASNVITGGAWYGNYVGVHAEIGKNGSSIVEGLKINVGFIATNFWASVWLYRTGQLAVIEGDHDYNGNRIGVIRIDEVPDVNFTDLAKAGKGTVITNGNDAAQLMLCYRRQGHKFMVVAFDHDVQITHDANGNATSTGAPWKVGDVLSSTNPDFAGFTITIVSDLPNDAAINTKKTITVCQSEYPNLNFFDIWHDFETQPFGKVQVKAGYLGGIIGGNQFTSNFQFNRGVIDRPLFEAYGMGITNGAGNFALSNEDKSPLPFMTVVTAPTFSPASGTIEHFTNFDRRVNLFNNAFKGQTFYVGLSGSARGVWQSINFFKDRTASADSGNKQLANEGTTYLCNLSTDQAGISGVFWLLLRQMAQSDGTVKTIATLYNPFKIDANWELGLADDDADPDGVWLCLRQDVQDSCTGILTATRL